MIEFYNLKIEEALTAWGATKEGLSTEEAKKRLEKYGKNIIKKEHRITVFAIFLSQFKNAILMLLVFTSVLSFAIGEKLEGTVIFGIILLDAILGFVQEYRAEKAIEALEKLSAPTAKVLRDGKETKIPASELVPGDILLLEAGDIVAADSRIIEAMSLQIDEASLTGESVPSKKVIHPYPIGTSVADQENMAFASTTTTYGKGKSIVTATAMSTELGRIATSIQSTREVQTPLQQKFKHLAKQIGIITIMLVLTVLISGTIQATQTLPKMLVFVLALIVSTIPNSLPIIVTVSLSMGAKRLVKKNMLIKKLSAAESLGAATIICSDKTGTITKNQMTVREIYADKKILTITGSGYTPAGEFYQNSKQINPKSIELLLRTGYLCNNAKLSKKENNFEIIGDPTEGALIVLGKKGMLNEEDLHEHLAFVEELPFDSERKRMSVIYENKINGKKEVYTKGAPEMLLPLCTTILENSKIKKLTNTERKKILDINNAFAKKALRVLAVAYRDISHLAEQKGKEIEKELTFVGLVGMIDPPRDEVEQAVEECEEAGIKVMMITGDHVLTAKAVAQEIGLLKKEDVVLTGDEIEKMSDEELQGMIEKVRIIARALPIQKLRIVQALQKNGHVVAMTGDGVNDAPALKKADIGIAMGITGTDVAKEVSKAILVDDNFATIVNAVAEGRNIYQKMIKSATYLLSCNCGEIITIFVAIMLKMPLPMLPLQLLVMSLLTDDFPALGLGLEKMEEGIMQLPPRDPKKKPITTKMLISIIIFGIIMAAGTLFMFVQYKDDNLPKAQTIAFTTLVMFQMFAVMSSRTTHHSLKELNPFSNMLLFNGIVISVLLQILVVYLPPLQKIFGTVSLSSYEWLLIIAVSSIGFVMMEVSKIFVNFKTANTRL